MESSQLSLCNSCTVDSGKTNIDVECQDKEVENGHTINGHAQLNQSSSQCSQKLDDASAEISLGKLNLHGNLTSDMNSAKSHANSAQETVNGIALGQPSGIRYTGYKSEVDMPPIMKLITNGLSEPYSIYTYRYFLHNWPHLSFLAWQGNNCIGAIVCKLDIHKKIVRRGYIAMLAVDGSVRCSGIGTNLVQLAIDAMRKDDCDEVVLETEITNKAALHLYENLGFVRDKRLFRYYLNGVDALRLKLWCK